MLIRKPSDIPSSEITSKSDYMNRRKFMTGAVALGVAALVRTGLKTSFHPAKLFMPPRSCRRFRASIRRPG